MGQTRNFVELNNKNIEGKKYLNLKDKESLEIIE
jgi:hypothetical protein